MENVGFDKAFAFAVEMVRAARELRGRNEYELANQLLRCGTSIGANLAESEFAQSKADFVSKLTIALKEASETRYWIRLLVATETISYETSAKLMDEINEIIKILAASVKTSKQNL